MQTAIAIGLCLTGTLVAYLGFSGLRFRKNKENCYQLQDLALFGGRFGTVKNFSLGLSSLLTGKHLTLRTPALTFLLGIAALAYGICLLSF